MESARRQGTLGRKASFAEEVTLGKVRKGGE